MAMIGCQDHPFGSASCDECARFRKPKSASVTYAEAMEEEKRRRVIIDYTNYRGERGARTICHPMTLEFMATDWHPVPQWILYAFDLKKNEMRGFAMKCIHSWDAADLS